MSPEDRSRLRDLFERLMKDRAHVALVVDEYGGTAGLVSLEDLVETLLGLEIVDRLRVFFANLLIADFFFGHHHFVFCHLGFRRLEAFLVLRFQ